MRKTKSFTKSRSFISVQFGIFWRLWRTNHNRKYKYKINKLLIPGWISSPHYRLILKNNIDELMIYFHSIIALYGWSEVTLPYQYWWHLRVRDFWNNDLYFLTQIVQATVVKFFIVFEHNILILLIEICSRAFLKNTNQLISGWKDVRYENFKLIQRFYYWSNINVLPFSLNCLHHIFWYIPWFLTTSAP